MGGYKAHAPAAYLVRWGDVWKAGYSASRRWRKFELRGAEVVRVTYCESARDALALEDAWLVTLSERGHRAFQTKSDAVPYVGPGGGGWLECWCLCDAQASCACIAQPHCTAAMHASNPMHLCDAPMHVRTNELTQSRCMHLREGRGFLFSDARAHTAEVIG